MMANTLKTTLFLLVLAAVLLLVGGAVGGRSGMFIALGIALAMHATSYWYADTIILGMYGAQAVTEAEAPRLYASVRRLAQRAQLPMPRVYVIPADAPNAFATGRNPDRAAVAVTEGMLQFLDSREIEGVLAHELAHIKNHGTFHIPVDSLLTQTQ